MPVVVGPNFGCGSSREHAVWGLSQIGMRAILGEGLEIGFDIEPAREEALIHGLDIVGTTLTFADDIRGFEREDRETNPWLF